ncbi:MAG TPA: exosome complex exonuclease Rrp41 [Candidatus Thermoplasmatota archaeon]|nr:exosome complex exonuclease Rrp41 [Candidatus Thermoplasmatota archaeon]
MGGNKPEGMVLFKDGRRMDGRKPDELRQIKIEAGVLTRADGSCYLEWGGNKILAAVYGPREAHPRHDQDPTQAIVRCRYNMAAFSVSDRKRPGPDRRSQEITKITSEALKSVVITQPFPKTAIDIFVEVLEAEAGTRCAGLTAASVALADAGIPMRGLVTSVAAGKVDGHVCLDLSREEDNFGETDLPTAWNMKTGECVLLQMDGHFTEEEIETAISMTERAAQEIHRLQKDALLRRYKDAGQGGLAEPHEEEPAPPIEEEAPRKPDEEEDKPAPLDEAGNTEVYY